MSSPFLLSLLLALAAPQQDSHHSHGPAPADAVLGEVDFPVSCNPAAQKSFTRAMALLHSFWYDEARKAFEEAAAADSSCGMAFWGVAMSHYHPLWVPPNPQELQAGDAAVQEGLGRGAQTDRERAYLKAIQAFYLGHQQTDHGTRAKRYLDALNQLRKAYPDDDEATIFYALQLDGTHPSSDKTLKNPREAGRLLEPIFKKRPNHPGVAHYVIHSYDYPDLAEMGLDAARRYSKIAPDSPHALHMPSHIFTRLGLWDESIQSNLASAAAGRAHVERTSPGVTSWDELHASDYLVYAYLQRGHDAKAKKLRDWAAGLKGYDQPNFAAAFAVAAIPGRLVLERRAWKEAADLKLGGGLDWPKFPYAEAQLLFARGVGLARSGAPAKAASDLERLQSLQAKMQAENQTYGAPQIEVLAAALAAWVDFTGGRSEEALRKIGRAVEVEGGTEKHPVTPGSLTPALEMQAEMLLELNRPAEALASYEASLKVAPNRFLSLWGAARAARALKDERKAKKYGQEALALMKNADSRRPELAELERYR